MMKKLFLASLPLLFVGCLFGSSKMTRPGVTVASVNGRIITVADFDSTFKQIQKNVDPGADVGTIKHAALDSLIARQLIQVRRDSIKEELNKDWEFNQKKIDDITQTIFKVLFEKQISNRIHFDTADVARHYEQNKDKYIDQEKVWARHILIRRPKPDTTGLESAETRQKAIDDADKFALERAEGVLKKVQAGENWDTLAATYSEDNNNAKKGGDLGYFYRGRMMPSFDSAAFAAAPGSILGPISTRYGYHIIKVEDHKDASPRSLDPTLSAEIYEELLSAEEKKLSTAYVDSLKTAARYQYNEEQLSLPDTMIEDREWIMAVNECDTVFGVTLKQSLPRFRKWKQLDTLTVENKKEMLGMLASTYLLRCAARQLGLMSNPEVVKAADEFVTIEANLRTQHLINDVEYDPTQEEIAAYFNAHVDDYRELRPILVHHILFQDYALAQAVRDTIIAGGDFTEMAKRYYPGDPDIREVLFNLDYIGPDEMGPDFYAVAETMAVGSVSQPVQTSWGYHLINLVNKKQDKTLAQVKPGIRQKLKDARNALKTSGLVAQWRESATIVVNDKVIQKYQPEGKKVIRIEAKAPEQKGS
jgi:parvulin-like peptidyl-prolyl isomerase